uniref:Ankyrin repeat and SAM domain-containing protein 6 n=1 Tax=Acrobeloides nanus TaxID=290746 RepID=A0A914DRJ3_9BILA
MSGSKYLDWHEDPEIDKIQMLEACLEGNIPKVAEYLKRVYVDDCDDDSVTALQIAAAKGHLRLVEFLLDEDADIEFTNEVGFTPLLHACREGHLEVVKLLLQRGADYNVTSFMGASALTLACAGGHVEVVKMLINLRSNVLMDSLNQDMLNPANNDMAPTPLMAAAYRSQMQIASCLVSRGAKADYANPRLLGLSALNIVITCGSPTMFSTLLDLGASATLKNFQNRHAKSAQKLNAYDLAIYLGRRDIMQILENYDQHKAIKYVKLVDIREVILENQLADLKDLLSNPQKQENLPEGITPLMFAVACGNFEAVKIIVESGCDLNAQEYVLGLTALMLAIVKGENDMVLLLLRAGAKVDIACNMEKTALDLAYMANGISWDTLKCLHKRLVGEDYPITKKETPGSPSTPTKIQKPLSKLFSKIRLVEQEEVLEENPRERILAEFDVSNVDWAVPDHFVMAEDILRGDRRHKMWRKPGLNDYIHLARSIVQSWCQNCFLLKPFPVGIPYFGDYKRFNEVFFFSNNGNNDYKSDENGNYSLAQINSAKYGYRNRKPFSVSDSIQNGSFTGSLRRYKRDPQPIRSSARGSLDQPIHKPSTTKSLVDMPDYGSKLHLFTPPRTRYSAQPLSVSMSQPSSPDVFPKNEFKLQTPLRRPVPMPKISSENFYGKNVSLTEQLIRQQLAKHGVEKYFEIFKNQEVDPHMFVELDQQEVLEIICPESNQQNREFFMDSHSIVNAINEIRQLCGLKTGK